MRAVQSLLMLKGAVDNWQELQRSRNLTGWDSRVPVCTWGGLACDAEGNVITL